MEIKIIHINIERDTHLDSVRELIKKTSPDVVCVCEARERDVKSIAEAESFDYVFSPLVQVVDELQGSAILSKKQILEHSNTRYDDNVSDTIPCLQTVDDLFEKNGNRPENRFQYHNSLLTIKIQGEKYKYLTIATTHFPVSDHSTRGYDDHTFDEMRDVEDIDHARISYDRLLSLLDSHASPLIFTADLNNPRGEYIYDDLAHSLVDLVPKNITSTLDPRLHRVKGLDLVVDTIMVSQDLASACTHIEVLENISDHKAIVATFSI